jgi:hypothetical protein
MKLAVAVEDVRDRDVGVVDVEHAGPPGVAKSGVT